MQMGKNLAATCSKKIKWVRSYQISYLLLDLCHLANTKVFFFQVSLLKVKTCLNRRLFMKTICPWQKNSGAPSQKKLTKLHDATCATVSELTGTFQNCTVKCPKSNMNEFLLNVPTFRFFDFVYIWAK